MENKYKIYWVAYRTSEYYYDNTPKKDYRLFSMMFVYENESGEQYASLVCDFDLVSRGYNPTGKAVFIPDNSFTL